MLYNCTERCTEVNCSVELGRGGWVLTPCRRAQVHFQGISPQVLADTVDPMLDLVALRLSQLLEPQMLVPVGERLSELPTLSSSHCHTHNAK